jgi:hypothetical protein
MPALALHSSKECLCLIPQLSVLSVQLHGHAPFMRLGRRIRIWKKRTFRHDVVSFSIWLTRAGFAAVARWFSIMSTTSPSRCIGT